MKTEFSMTGMAELQQKIAALNTDGPATRERMDKVINQALAIVKQHLQQSAKSIMKSDPREAHKAVVYTVYNKILGGNVNILNRRTRLAPTDYSIPRTLQPGQRGGNRRKRSARTEQLNSYQSYDRVFVLNFLNAGARAGGGNRGGSKGGNRGHIRATNFFATSSRQGMAKAMAYIDTEVGKMIDELWSR